MATKKATSAPLKATTSASTSVALKKAPAGGNIMNITEALKAQVASMGGRIAPGGGNQIRLSKSGFELPDGSKTPGPLELVIVDFTTSHRFYDTKYDPKNPTPPGCFAIGLNPKDMTPSPNSPNLQSDSCQTCPHNVFGPNGERKACNNNRLLAVLPPDADEDTPIWLLSVSPGALKGFDGYVAGVVRTFTLPPISVVTTVGLLADVDYPSLTFSNPVQNPNLAAHFARQAEARELLQAEPDVSGYVAPGAKRGGPPAKRGPVRR